ncbi:MAG: protein kinase [Chitinivibrionales bacterium]|nr:protein kinase [Chitinivibrionales bacterium]
MVIDMATDDKRQQDALREAVEKTVPAEDFSSEAIKDMVERTAVDETPDESAGLYLRRTASDSHEATAPSETITRFGDTSEVPAQLTDRADAQGPRFTVIERIGAGATSQVYAIRDNSLERTIAVKFLKQARSKSDKARDRFLHEARVTAQLEHPNIMPIHDIGLDSRSRLFFTMKNVRGRSVGEAIRAVRQGEAVEGFGGVPEVLDIFFKVCDAIGFAHENGYIHQDIKPDNIMLGGHGEVLLLDWGCALDRHAQTETAGKAIYGTPAYMSPEQARREIADERSDVYCVGATLYHMLTLHHPTWADDAETFWAMKCAGELTPLPDEAAERAPVKLLDICRTAMAPDRERRYGDIAAFRAAVRQYQVHAESIALTADARQRLVTAVEQSDYALFSEVSHDLRQALRMWPGYAEAQEAATQTRRAYASCALERDDLQLAESIVGDDPALQDIRERIEAQRAAQQRHRLRTRITQAAAAVLGIAVLGFIVYLAVDSLRYFGKWRTVYHWDSSQGAPEGLSRSVAATTPLTTSTDSIDYDGDVLKLRRHHMLWLDSVRVPYDVRFEIVAMWPDYVDGLELHIQARRERFPEWSMCPAGFTCQFGGSLGLESWISRQDEPRTPTTSSAVAVEFEPGRWYRFAFERRDNTVAIFVDGRRVQRQMQLLPLPGKGFEHLAVRCWRNLRIRSITVQRMALPRKASPLVVGDDAIVRGDFTYAVEQYLRLADDFPEDRVAEPALAKAYLAANQLRNNRNRVKDRVRKRLAERFPRSRYWPTIKEAECLASWRERQFATALSLLAEVFAQDPETRLALELLALRGDDPLPGEVTQGLLTWIARTTRVARLDLARLNLTSCEPLRGMALRRLELSANDISSLEPLAGMPLEYLGVRHNRVADLSPLSGMPLTQLNVAANLIADLSPLRGLPLQTINIACNKVEDLSPLREAPLRSAIVEDNRIRSLEPLRGMSIRELSANYNEISSLEPLAGMPLENLGIDGNPVSDLTPLSGVPLRGLGINRTRVSDLSPLAACTSLIGLEAKGSPVRNLSPLKGLSLETIKITSSAVTDLGPLQGMPLREIVIDSMTLSSLEPLRGAAPEAISLQATSVADLSVFDCTRLGNLNIAFSRISDLTPVQAAPLKVLNLTKAPVASLSPLRSPVPVGITLDYGQFDPGHLEECIARWRAWGDSTAAYALEVGLRVHQGDYERAAGMAIPFHGHRYLFVGGDFSYEQADSICRRLGAHMLTVTSADEYTFTRGLQERFFEYNIWLALPVDARPTHWLTGEPVVFNSFDQYTRPDMEVRWYQLVEKAAKGWFHDTRFDVRAGFIAEWDDTEL